jgi:hypothetical protein
VVKNINMPCSTVIIGFIQHYRRFHHWLSLFNFYSKFPYICTKCVCVLDPWAEKCPKQSIMTV